YGVRHGAGRWLRALRFVPKNKTVVLGLVTSKSGTLETKFHLKRPIDEGAKYLELDQLCLGPQCGFADGRRQRVGGRRAVGQTLADCRGGGRGMGFFTAIAVIFSL